MKRGGPLRRDPEKTNAWRRRSKPLARKASAKRPRSVSPASDEQRQKVKGARSIVSGEQGCDPMHVWPRSLGGCDSPLCVVPATRAEHDAYDNGELDLLPYLVRNRMFAELGHAVAHAGGLLQLLERVTNQRWEPVDG